jgi:hypothetical protein
MPGKFSRKGKMATLTFTDANLVGQGIGGKGERPLFAFT